MRLFRQIKNFLVFLIFIFSYINANEESLERVYRVLTLLPEWNGSAISVEELEGGLTNDNYKARVGLKDYFIRCGYTQNVILGVSLEREWQSTSIAAEAGLSPKTIQYHPEERIFITDFIETGDRDINLREPTSLKKFCDLVRELHSLKAEFPIKFCPFDSINEYIEKAIEVGAILPDSLFLKIIPWMKQLQLEIDPLSTCVPCHFDLHHRNVLDDGERYWLIDWEYAGMGDPFFDLATAASIEDFSEKEMIEFLRVYLNNRQPSPQEVSYFNTMRTLADIRWSLWCFLQSKISPQVNQPFLAFANFFLQNALNRLENEKPPFEAVHSCRQHREVQ